MTMVAKITTAISQSNFETVRDQIGALLKVELDNQALLLGTPASAGPPPVEAVPNPDIECEVYVERFAKIDRSEGNVVNVMVNQMSFDNQTPITQRNNAVFSIDVYAATEDEETSKICELSKYKLDRLVGIIHKIIQSPFYDRLQLSNGIVMHRGITQVLFSDKEDNNDSLSTRMARILLNVNIHEECSGITPIDAASYDTVVKLEATNKGYKFIYNNP